MPMWEWFAFDSTAVSSAILQPAQQAIRNRDLAAWQRVYDQLSQTHYRPYLSSYGSALGYSPNNATIITPGRDKVSRDQVPQESAFPLRRALQTFVEQVSSLKVEGKFPRARHWVLSEVLWPKTLKPQAERDELEQFKTQIIVRSEKLPDPFWCLESNSAVDSNYVAPEIVAQMAKVEATVGLFRGLVQRTDLGDEVHALARELAAASLLIELAASRGLALYFREDGT
jgi:hypothetical protein